jgi:hypothetical protein
MPPPFPQRRHGPQRRHRKRRESRNVERADVVPRTRRPSALQKQALVVG